MIPMRPDPDVIGRRLSLQRDLLRELTALGPLDAARLRSQVITRAAVERMVQAVVDLALDINAHVAASLLGRAPVTGRESFDLMAEAEVLTVELASRLKPAVGLRNVLVHLYADIDVDLVSHAVPMLLAAFDEYVRVLARWLLDRTVT